MYKYILILLTTFTVFASNAQYFAPTGATWYYGQGIAWGFPIVSSYMRFEVMGDTLINGQSCQVINKEDKWWCTGRPSVEFTYYSNDTVYFYDTTFASFQILYDFNSTPGQYWDILTPDYNDTDTLRVTVDSTDYININGQQLKRMFVTYTFFGENILAPNNTYTSTIVERLGDITYMFNFWTDEWGFCDINWPENLRCYEDTVLGYYNSGITVSCDYQAFWGLEELSAGSRELIKIVDLTGRETTETPNTALIYIYSDGTTEKVFKME